MHLACAANVVSLLTNLRLMTALLAISLHCRELRAVILRWCIGWWWVSSMLSWHQVERKLLQQLIHELFSKIELDGTNAPAKLQLTGGGRQTTRLQYVRCEHSQGRVLAVGSRLCRLL